MQKSTDITSALIKISGKEVNVTQNVLCPRFSFFLFGECFAIFIQDKHQMQRKELFYLGDSFLLPFCIAFPPPPLPPPPPSNRYRSFADELSKRCQMSFPSVEFRGRILLRYFVACVANPRGRKTSPSICTNYLAKSSASFPRINFAHFYQAAITAISRDPASYHYLRKPKRLKMLLPITLDIST